MGKAPTISAGPASGNDFFSVTEDQVTAGGLVFNVLANDPKKAALYSLDNATVSDLLQEDLPGAAELSALGYFVRITSDGKVAYDAGLNNSLIQGLGAGESLTDSFLYAFRQGGNLVWQTVTVTITGTNDAPVARADTGLGLEDSITTGSVAFNDSDVDHNAVLHFAATGNLPAGFAMASDGSWTLDGSDPSYQALCLGESVNVAVAYTVTDEHGASSNSTLVLTVTGTNDVPVTSSPAAQVAEGATASGQLTALDPDHGAALSFAVAGDAPAGFSLAANGSWAFDASGSAYDGLAEGEIRIVEVPFAVIDDRGASASSQLIIAVTGTNDAPVAIGQAVSATIEPYPASTTLTGQVTATDADAGAQLTYAMQGFVPDGFVMNSDGSWNWTLPLQPGIELNEGEVSAGQLTFVATDEHGATSTGVVQISLIGSNDAPIREDAFATATEGEVVTGTYHGVDPDRGAVLSYSLDPRSDPGFTLASDGSWQFDAGNPAYQSLAAGEARQVVAGILVTDEHGASALSPLFVTVTGTNDAPVLTGTATALANGVEDTAYTVTQAQLLGGWSDPDGDALVASGLGVANASVIANADGSFTITPAANYSGPLSLNYSVGDGTSAGAASLSLAIDPANDPAMIAGTIRGTLVEARNGSAGIPVASGTLTVADIDGDPHFQAVTSPTSSAGHFGTFTVTADGAWQYTLDNFNSQVNGLNTGQTLSDSFTVRAVDGTTQQISLTINGATDWVSVGPYANTNDPDNFDSATGPAGSENLNTTFVGTSASEAVTGGPADQTFDMQGGGDAIYAGAGNDTVYGGSGGDSIMGQAGNDFLNGDADNDSIFGGSGNDLVLGGDGFDTLYGGSGLDTVNGGAGDDFIYGGYNMDTLTGGAGSDWFNYKSIFDSGDVITDFQPALDTLDLHLIDANTTQAGDQAFTFSTNGAAFNSIWMIQNGSNIEIYGDTDGNPITAEFMLTLQNVTMDTAFPPPHFLF